MTETARNVEAEMKAAVAEGDYRKAGEIGTAAGFSLEFIDVVIANIEIELGRPERAKKFLERIQLNVEQTESAQSPSFAEMRKRREAKILARQKREQEELEKAKAWAAKAKQDREAAEQAQGKAEREWNQASSAAALPEARKPKPLVAANAVLQEMNERHAIIENVGGASVIASWEPLKFNPRWRNLVYQGKDSFLLRYSNRKVLVDYPGGGSGHVGLGKWWLDHEDRT
jgi:hypothetical protein